eukprot:TRINITY_DN11291_c0_g2_i1.p1 TRINITY_DN11291_c0_g2~~TRINITY_DN11291_c0_g2_i1.p1  ORF type:complete len:128 (-),score=50.91 TRINITY_DN11291_c0_g2_i1:292-675(-)
MKMSWKAVSKKAKNLFATLQMITSPDDNYLQYRSQLGIALPPMIPVLSLSLEDLLTVNENEPSTLEEGIINFDKYTSIAKIIRQIQQLQQVAYNLVQVPSIQVHVRATKILDDEYLDVIAKKFEKGK